ncbi:MAG TPA: hypothetical protein VFZ61_03875 [Polyangiales bacterium]
MNHKPLIDVQLLAQLNQIANASPEHCEAIVDTCLFAVMQNATCRLTFEEKHSTLEDVERGLRNLFERQLEIHRPAIEKLCGMRKGVTFKHDAPEA